MPSGAGSRVARVAAAAGASEADAATLLARPVRLEIDDESDRDAAVSLRTAVRLAVLMWKTLIVAVTAGYELAAACRAIAEELRPGDDAVTIVERDAAAGDEQVLRIGRTASRSPRVVTVCNSGWTMHVFAAATEGNSIVPVTLSASTRMNSLAAAGASALGIGELFLRSVSRNRPAVSYDLSLFDFTRGDHGSLDAGPPCPSAIEVHGALIGAGTVGSGFAYALSPFTVTGDLAVVDHDAAGSQNFGPHLYVTTRTSGEPKVDLVKGQLHADHPGLAVDAKPERFRLFRHRVIEDQSVPFPDVVVSGLDRAVPRQQVQRLWAPLHIDMATKDGLQVQLLVRTNPGRGICMIKKFPLGDERPEEDEIAARTGLTAEAIADDLGDITEADVANATVEHRDALRAAKARGERRCNVITRADLGEGQGGDDFVASAPFSALLAGVFAASELTKSRVMRLDRDGTLAMFHFVTTNVYSDRTRCADDCECAPVTARGLSTNEAGSRPLLTRNQMSISPQ